MIRTCQECKVIEWCNKQLSTCCVYKAPWSSHVSSCLFLFFVVFYHHTSQKHSLQSSLSTPYPKNHFEVITSNKSYQVILGSVENSQKSMGLTGIPRSLSSHSQKTEWNYGRIAGKHNEPKILPSQLCTLAWEWRVLLKDNIHIKT